MYQAIELFSLAKTEEEVKAINDLAKRLGEDKAFLEGFKKVTLAEVRRENYLGRDTTGFRLVVE